MKLAEIFAGTDFAVSIEIFPPKEGGEEILRDNLRTLMQYQPKFVSCTYGAGGSTRDKTVQWCREIQEDFSGVAMGHFTCVGSTREELVGWLHQATDAGIKNIMALRGDPPHGETQFQAVEGGLQYANELVELIRETCPDVGIGVAGYPETHQEAPSAAVDLENLKRKVDAGADAVFTQLFFINENFFRFRDQCDAAGIRVPVVPGIMPITNFARIKRIAGMCGTQFPDDLVQKLEAVSDDTAAQFEVGVEFAVEQCRQLRQEGVPGIHFYALNRSAACQRILDRLEFAREVC